MTQRTTYIVSFTYNAGLLGTEKGFATEEEAREFANKYKNEFEDCGKFYTIEKYTRTKRMFKKAELTVSTIETWFEE